MLGDKGNSKKKCFRKYLVDNIKDFRPKRSCLMLLPNTMLSQINRILATNFSYMCNLKFFNKHMKRSKEKLVE